jgi:hypothetical protein
MAGRSQLRSLIDSSLPSDWTFYLSAPVLLVLPRVFPIPSLSDLDSVLHLTTLSSVLINNEVYTCTTYTDLWQHWRSAMHGFYFALVAQAQLSLFVFYEDRHMGEAAQACVQLLHKLKDTS